MEMAGADLDLPGFRFHPTEEELLDFYLRRMVRGKKFDVEIIRTINLYRHDPWELPRLAKIGEREWYFFVPRDRKQSNGGRPNRTTERGFWKATGSDRTIRSAADPKRLIGLKKTLVFYQGRAPRGSKTDWVMNEYRLPDNSPSSSIPSPKEDIVLCKIYRKATSLKELEQRAALEEEARANSQGSSSVSVTDTTTVSSSSDLEAFQYMSTANFDISDYKDDQVQVQVQVQVQEEKVVKESSVVNPMNLPELQVPTYGLDWMQDPFLTQLRSPWLQHLSPYSDMLNF